MRIPIGGNSSSTVPATFELVVAGYLPPGMRFFGVLAQGQRVDAEVQLTDPDGEGMYIGSVQVKRDAERGVGIVQRDGAGRSDLIKDFGLVKFAVDKTFSTSVSFG